MSYSKAYSVFATVVFLSLLLPQRFAKAKTPLPEVLKGINEAFSDGSRSGRPIVVVHGLGAHYQEISSFLELIERATDNRRPIYSAPYLESMKSLPFFSLQKLSKRLGKFVQVLLEHKHINVKTGFDIVGVSLGGVVARIYIENAIKYQHPRVRNFATMGSPHHGLNILAVRSMTHVRAKYQKAKEKIKRAAWKAAVMMSEKLSPFVRTISYRNKNIVPEKRTLAMLDSISTLVYEQDSLVTPFETQRVKIDGEFSCSVQRDHFKFTREDEDSYVCFLNNALAETEEDRSKNQLMNKAMMLLGDMDCSRLNTSVLV